MCNTRACTYENACTTVVVRPSIANTNIRVNALVRIAPVRLLNELLIRRPITLPELWPEAANAPRSVLRFSSAPPSFVSEKRSEVPRRHAIGIVFHHMPRSGKMWHPFVYFLGTSFDMIAMNPCFHSKTTALASLYKESACLPKKSQLPIQAAASGMCAIYARCVLVAASEMIPLQSQPWPPKGSADLLSKPAVFDSISIHSRPVRRVCRLENVIPGISNNVNVCGPAARLIAIQNARGPVSLQNIPSMLPSLVASCAPCSLRTLHG